MFAFRVFAGEMCVEKPLCNLWKNYTCTQKPDVHMKLTITQSGLKAFTKEHGLTEYWSHRVTYCLASPQFPRIFCWVYRHEGRKLKQELRCHAVVCSKESVARQIAGQLQSRLAQALNEFRRDKISRQNARLSLANSVYENPSLPRRKILLSTGSHNYRPPLERSKSAPRLMSIEESLEEDEEPSAAAGDDAVGAAAFRRCRADSRLRTGTLRNRLGGLHGYHRDAAAVVTAAVASAAVASAGGAAEVAGAIGDRLAQSLQLRDDEGVVADPTAGRPDAERVPEPSSSTPPPSYRDAVAADDDQLQFVVELSPAAAPACGPEQQQQQHLPPKYNEVIVDRPQGPEDVCYKYNSLVRDRKRLFESFGGGGGRGGGGGLRDQFKRMSSDSELLGAYNNLVKNRKLLFEGCGQDEEDDEEDLDVDLLEEDLDEEKDCGYPDDESTPSLQSISSGGSDACKKIAMDLDSLSEEDSDESGYVEAPPSRCPADAVRADDKEKDLHKRAGNGHLKASGGAACRNAAALRRVVGM